MLYTSAFSQTSESFLIPSDSLNIPRRNAVIITEASLAAISLIGLDQLWYSDYQRSKFHVINDNDEWFQMDKLGHVFSSYQLGRVGANVLQWSGVKDSDQLYYGATLGFVFLSTIEVFDGYSEEWGFSWGDIAANATGTSLYIGQQLLWEEQRIALKYSFHQTSFASQRPDKLGNGFFEEVLKDYNGQTYWLSANVNSFFKNSKIPKWFNVALGYGVDGLLEGRNKDSDLGLLSTKRKRQFYLSLDLDLSRIPTNSHLLKTLFDVFNLIKVPFPTLELNSEGRLKWHYIYF